MNRQIYIKTQFEGFHKYNNAPEDVAFLRNLHRHIFHIIVTVPVTHSNRELEFFEFKADINEFIRNNINFYDAGSCEMIAEAIAVYVSGKYQRQTRVDVNEDLENGAIVEL